LYGWDLYNLKTFRSIKLQSNDVFEPQKLNVTLGLKKILGLEWDAS